MSGRHRVVKPRRRVGLAAVRVPVRALARWVRAGRDGMFRAWARLAERARERFERRDPFADVHLDPQATSPDPIPAQPAPAEEIPAPLVLATDQVLPVLHTQHPHLPGSHVQWHRHDAGVHGEVNALEVDEDGQRRVVNAYAAALGAEVVEADEGERAMVSTTGTIGGVPVTVAAVFAAADTIPLRVYRESASAQDTQALPDEVLQDVVA